MRFDCDEVTGGKTRDPRPTISLRKARERCLTLSPSNCHLLWSMGECSSCRPISHRHSLLSKHSPPWIICLSRLATSLLFQILHDPARRRFCRGGVLTGVQLTVNHDVLLESRHLLILSPEFFDPFFNKNKESEILGVMARVSIHSRRKVFMINRPPHPCRWPIPPRW